MDIRYWDSVCFLGWFNDEPDKQSQCETVIKAAESGLVIIATSAISLTEVIKIKGYNALTKDKEETIAKFFRHPYISIRNVDPFIARRARQLIWENEHLKPKDSIHLATAIHYKLPFLDTFDSDLTKLDGEIDGAPKIGPPKLPMQPDLLNQ